jgi:N-acetylglutamate synthase
MTVSVSGLFDCCEATWPAASHTRIGPWLVRDGQGAGKRVSSVTAEAGWTREDIPLAEQACRDLGQDLLFQIRPEDAKLDTVLAARGYDVIDPVDFLVAPVEALTADLHRLAAIPCWPPLAVQAEIWAEGGIGPARRAVMERAEGPKTALMGVMMTTPSPPPSWPFTRAPRCCTRWKCRRTHGARGLGAR